MTANIRRGVDSWPKYSKGALSWKRRMRATWKSIILLLLLLLLLSLYSAHTLRDEKSIRPGGDIPLARSGTLRRRRRVASDLSHGVVLTVSWNCDDNVVQRPLKWKYNIVVVSRRKLSVAIRIGTANINNCRWYMYLS